MLHLLKQKKDITNLSGFKTKASSKYFFEIKNPEDLEKIKEIIEFSKKEKLELVFL
jgi:NDP-sugar pyrophosphorylase family protein